MSRRIDNCQNSKTTLLQFFLFFFFLQVFCLFVDYIILPQDIVLIKSKLKANKTFDQNSQQATNNSDIQKYSYLLLLLLVLFLIFLIYNIPSDMT